MEIEITITVEDSDIWQEIVGIEKQEAELGREEDWNMEETIDKGE